MVFISASEKYECSQTTSSSSTSNTFKLPSRNPHTIEECVKLVLRNGWTLQGHSRAGERTGFLLHPLNILFDAGLETKKRPNVVLISHKHFDHLYNLPLIGSIDRSGDRGGPVISKIEISRNKDVDGGKNKDDDPIVHCVTPSGIESDKNRTKTNPMPSPKLRPTYMPRSARAASELLFKAVRLISGVHGSKFEDVDCLDVFEIQGINPQIVKAGDKFILGKDVSQEGKTHQNFLSHNASFNPSNYTEVEVLKAYHGDADGEGLSVGYGLTTVKSKMKQEIINEWVERFKEKNCEGLRDVETTKTMDDPKKDSVDNEHLLENNKPKIKTKKAPNILGRAIQGIKKLHKENPYDPTFSPYDYSITETVRVPELAFYCDSQILNLTNHEEWKKYPIVICECTGFPESHPDPQKVQKNYHTHLNELEVVMREFKHLHDETGSHEEKGQDYQRDNTSQGTSLENNNSCDEYKIKNRRLRQWIVIHTSLSASPFQIWNHQKRLREDGIDVTFWIDSL